MLLRKNPTHCLEDDLESFIYLILYAYLRWLPAESSLGLEWWFTTFFRAPGYMGCCGGGDAKNANAVFRRYTSRLGSAKSPQVIQWLSNAVDLHYSNKFPNPVWNGGKALGEMWKNFLQTELPLADRCVNRIIGVEFFEDHPLYTTYTITTSFAGQHAQHNDSLQLPVSAPTKRPQSPDGRVSKRARR